ncbi:MAG: HAD family phosphatase [Candidatus Doudnabacteria bacterium]|nr:HAD family phosphatase [Candidatus Doudnabacteria bacterium]
MKPVAIFDIDGTIFRSSLTIELLRELMRAKQVPASSVRTIQRYERQWLDRRADYGSYIWEIVRWFQHELKGRKQREIVAASKRVISQHKLRTYRYTLDLLAKIRRKYFTIGISGSLLEVVREYNKFLKFDKFYGWEFGTDAQGRYTGTVLYDPPRYKKEVIARYVKNHGLSFSRSVGVGDTESDIGFLELVEKPIAFNPNRKLAERARKANWPIVIERKDLIVEFQPKKVKFLKV